MRYVSGINMRSNMKLRHDHNTKEKAKARKSGPSLCSKTKDLGAMANVFAFTAYYDPTYRCIRAEAHLPEGEELPNINEILEDALSENAYRKLNRQRRRLPNRSQHVRRNTRGAPRKVVRQSQDSPRSSGENNDLPDCDAEEASPEPDGVSESDTMESGYHFPIPTIQAATVVEEEKLGTETVVEEPSRTEAVIEQQEEVSKTPKDNASQVPASSSDNTRENAQSFQPSNIQENTWGGYSADFDFASDSINDSTSFPSEFDFDINGSEKLAELTDRPGKSPMLPPLRALRLAPLPPPRPRPQTPDIHFNKVVEGVRLFYDDFQEISRMQRNNNFIRRLSSNRPAPIEFTPIEPTPIRSTPTFDSSYI
ncbi:hypothetical protein V8C42DRAFT_224490 [Trichoderma barbatum]